MANDNKREKRVLKTTKNRDIRGDSVDELKKLESANQYLNEGEISQQNNNL